MSSDDTKNPTEEQAKGGEGEVISESLGNGEVIESNWSETYATFDEMDLKEELLRGIYR